MGGWQSSIMGGWQSSNSHPGATPLETIDEAKLKTHTLSMTIHDERLTEGKGEITYRGPLTERELVEISKRGNFFFIIEFPMFNNQMAYLDTVNYSLKFREEDRHDLSVLMKLELTTGTSLKSDYRWSTMVMPNRYYSVTDAGVLPGSRAIKFLQYDKPEDAVVWRLGAQSFNMLTFSQTVDQTVWSSQPTETGQQKIVLGFPASFHSLQVYQVTGIPEIIINTPGTNDK